jgi:hypothetical protein
MVLSIGTVIHNMTIEANLVLLFELACLDPSSRSNRVFEI